ncbi:MAG: xanthine dehydrogenase family protein molybdopterin-binding subunit [Lachnospiraceae bacterium]|nr:xanthine dehydrogenase family protein molybdopterin-binding subunit [Lachnospiraceae bacterium]
MRCVGKSHPIHDAVGKATGRLRYAGDMELQGMLHMALLFSTIPHGIVKKLDCSKALEYPGVVDVMHCFNTTTKKYNRYLTQFRQDLIYNECIFNTHVRFVGDRIAGVIAETEEAAREAVKLIEVEYEEYPYALTTEEALTGKIDNVFPEGAVFGDYTHDVGEKQDTKDLIKVRTNANLSRINHICMETHVCVADYRKEDGQLTIYSPNQAVFGIRTLLGGIFDMDANKIRVIKTTMGGSFGGKQEWVLEPVTAAAAMRVNRPVRLVYNRSETIISAYSRAPMHFETEMDFTKDGQLQNVDCDLTLDAGAYLGNSINYARTVAHKMFRTYKYPYCHYHSKAVITNTIVSGAFRGWTSPEATVMFEHSMNVAARRLNMDPVELRLKNVMHENDIDLMCGVSLGNYKIRQALEQGRDHFEWNRRKEEVRKFNETNKRYLRGLGVSAGGHVNNFYPGKTDFARVTMSLNESGTILCNMTLHDHGCGTVMAMKMIAAEALGVMPEQVKIGEGDTDVTPLDLGCFSSRTTYVLGNTTIRCAEAMLASIIECTARYSGEKEEDLYIEDRVVYSRTNPDLHYTWSDVFDFSMQSLKQEVFVSEDYIPESNPGVCGVHFAEVEVDTYTGMTRIVDYLAVHDIGKAINPEICRAQTQGAVIMGSGAALTEHVLTRSNGKPSGSLKDYHLINSWEAPNVKVEFIEEGGDPGPYGAKSIGEVCHTPVAAAVMGAVNDALDSEIDTIPITPDVIMEYLHQKSEEAKR